MANTVKEEDCLSLNNNSELFDQKLNIDNPDEWLAIKADNPKNKKNDLLNIVSLSVELEKIIIVTREHNRLVTDDRNTKQWCGIFTLEQLYLIHQQICQIDPELDKLYPDQLRPIKGYLSTYFSNDLSKTINKSNNDSDQIDLQDNFLCNSISDYLKKACESLGISLYVDILFNDLNSNDYFEIYSEFNLKRLHNEIDKLKLDFFSLINNNNNNNKVKNEISIKIKKINSTFKKNFIERPEEDLKQDFIREFKINILIILNLYSNQDKLYNNLLKIYAEFYNNLLKPLVDSRELAKANLSKYEKKLANQLKTLKYLNNQSINENLNKLIESINKSKLDIFDLSNDIDQLCIEYKQYLIELNSSMLENVKIDKQKFILPKNNPNYIIFEFITRDRLNRLEDEIIDKKLQMHNIQLGLYERQKENLIDQEKEKELATKLNDLNIKIIKLKLEINNQEETALKKELNKIKNENINNKHLIQNENVVKLVKDLGLQFVNDLKENYKIDLSFLLNIEINTNTEYDDLNDLNNESDDEYEDSKFYDAHEDPESIHKEEAREKQIKINELNTIKKKILMIGSKKSSLRIALNKLNEKIPEELEPEIKSPAKSFALKKEEDKIQKEMYVKNRNKALQRLREYKLKNSKNSSFSSNDSLASTSTVIKKPYVPKSKQRILPPNFNQTKRQEYKNTSKSFSNEIKLENCEINCPLESKIENISPDSRKESSFLPLLSSPPPPPPLFPSNLLIGPSIPSPPPPPPPAPSVSLFLNDQTSSAIKMPPPPPPPLNLNQSEKIFNFSDSKIKSKSQEIDKINRNKKEVKIEFDLNEIKNFKFKKSNKSKNVTKDKPITNQFNSWESLMNEIRNNAGRNLRNINNNDKDSKYSNRYKQKSKFDLDFQQLKTSSKLEWDLNLILSQRSKFFNKDDDEDDSSSESSWSASNEN